MSEIDAEGKTMVGRVEKVDYDLWKKGRIVILTVRRSEAPLDANDMLIDVSPHGSSPLLRTAEAVLAAGIVNPTGSEKMEEAKRNLVKAVREVKG